MQISKFSPNGEFLAVCSPDGHLRVWETATNKLWNEFIPSAHLSAPCTCLDWAPVYQEKKQKGKKKKKKIVEGNIIVLGTAVGSLLFYNVTKNQVVNQPGRKSSASNPIHGLTWNPYTMSVYTCGNEGIVKEWDSESSSITSEWTIGKGNLTAIQSMNTHLLIAGQSIHFWDLKANTTIATFVGHPGYINQLEVIPSTDYFVSVSHDDRHLRIWQKEQPNSVVTLAIPELPVNCHVSTSENGTASISVTTEKGVLHVFQHKLNGHTKKPLKPTSTVTVVDSASDDSNMVHIVSGFLSGTSNVSVLAAYGDWLTLKFEVLDISSLQSDNVLTREFSHQTIIKSKSKKKPSSSIEISSMDDHVEVPNDVKHLQPGTETLHKVPTSTKGKKRKQNNNEEEEEPTVEKEEGTLPQQEDGELPMEERLTNLTIDAPSRSDLPKGENLAHLLSQGLHSKDVRILHSVLYRWDPKVVMNTVRSLPVQLVIPLLEVIKVMLTGKAVINHTVLKWLGAVFQIHSSYLMSCPSSEEQMGPIMSLLRARETLYPQMCLLKGKLELIKGHVAAKQFKADVPNTALLTYQDESSEDEDANDDTLLPSESEDFLTSDDLGVDENSDSDSGESNKDDDNDIELSAGSGSEEDYDDDDAEGVKINGRINGSEEDESMDED